MLKQYYNEGQKSTNNLSADLVHEFINYTPNMTN